MEEKGFIGRLFYFFERVMRITQFQLLWVMFTLCGGVILGIMPSTISLFTVIRKWLMGNTENQSFFKLYWTTFRKEFWKSNILGFILTLISVLIYLNLSFLPFIHGFIYWISLIFVFMLCILFSILLFYIFPSYVHLDLQFSRYFSISILLGVSFPFHTLLNVVGYFCVYLLLKLIPGLIPFVSISLFALVSMWVSMKVFKRMELKEVYVSSKVNTTSQRKSNQQQLKEVQVQTIK